MRYVDNSKPDVSMLVKARDYLASLPETQTENRNDIGFWASGAGYLASLPEFAAKGLKLREDNVTVTYDPPGSDEKLSHYDALSVFLNVSRNIVDYAFASAGFDHLIYQYEFYLKKTLGITTRKALGLAKLDFIIDLVKQGKTLHQVIVTVNTCTGIMETLAASTINVYPNPATDIIQVEYTGKVEQLTVLNMNGKVILTSSNVTTINVNELEKGLYFLQIKTSQGSTYKKIQVE